MEKDTAKFEKTVMKLWPKARIVSLHSDFDTKSVAASFEFPGSNGVATFSSSDLESVTVQPDDMDAWLDFTSNLERKKKKIKKKKTKK